MKEVLETDKQTIERLTNKVDELFNENKKLKQNQKIVEDMLASIGVGNTHEEFINFIKFLYENKNEFIEFLNMKKSNKNITEDISIVDQTSVENKIKEAVDVALLRQKKEFDGKLAKLESNVEDNILFKQINDQNKLLLENNEKLIQDIKIKDNTFEEYKKQMNEKIKNINSKINNKSGIPSPSSSDETKNRKRKNNNTTKNGSDKIKINDNILEVVYYRNINSNKFLPKYFLQKDIPFLECCNKQYNDISLFNNEVTCTCCYKTYILLYSDKKDNFNNNYKLVKKILPEHIINNENELLLKIKCNTCDFISKKEINLCTHCYKDKQGTEFINNFKLFNKPDINDEFYKSKMIAAQETYSKILHLTNLYTQAQKDGIDVTNFNEIVDYIKENKLMEDKQKNIIKFKIQRAYAIMLLYNEEKYVNIQDYIKRINFKIKDLSRLSHDKWLSFRKYLEDVLDEELKVNVKENSKENNIIIDEEKIKNECCMKCDNILKSDELRNCNKCKNLCILDDCSNQKAAMFGSIIEFCKEHANDKFSKIY